VQIIPDSVSISALRNDYPRNSLRIFTKFCTLGYANRRKFGVFAPQTVWVARMNTPIGDRLFQDIPRRVAKFRNNRPRDVKNLWAGKKEKITRSKHNSLRDRVSLTRSRATVLPLLRRNGPVIKSVESNLRLEGNLRWERFVKEVGRITVYKGQKTE